MGSRRLVFIRQKKRIRSIKCRGNGKKKHGKIKNFKMINGNNDDIIKLSKNKADNR